MVKNVKQKGSAFERKIAKLFEAWTGYKWKKTILSGGSWEKGDITPAYRRSEWVIELKNTEGWRYKDFWTGKGFIWKWWAKLLKEADGRRPLLVMTQNFSPTLAVISNTDPLAEYMKDAFDTYFICDNFIVVKLDDLLSIITPDMFDTPITTP